MTPAKPQTDDQQLSQYKKYITNIREVVFTIGFNRSGSSLVGDFLAGHPNIVMSHEIGVLRKYKQGEITTRDTLLLSIIEGSFKRYKRKNYIAGQDNYDSIEVIGDKHSPNNTFAVTKAKDDIIVKLQALLKLPIKFLFTIRNPYDMISSMVTKTSDGWESEQIYKAISYFTECSFHNQELIKRLPNDMIFTIRNEEFIANPLLMLADMCDFLDVVKTPDYLSDCVASCYRVPNRSRDNLDWDAEMRKQVDALIEKYEFFDGYSWDT